MNILYKFSAGIGRVSLPQNKQRALVSSAVYSEPGNSYSEAPIEPFVPVEISAAVYRDETDEEQLQRMIDAGWLPDLPWENHIQIPEDHAALTADVSLITVGEWASLDSIKVAPTPIYIPPMVSSRQFKLQLFASGLYDAVETWVLSQPLPTRIAYSNSSTFVRDDKTLENGFKSMGVTKEQIDAFFIAASRI